MIGKVGLLSPAVLQATGTASPPESLSLFEVPPRWRQQRRAAVPASRALEIPAKHAARDVVAPANEEGVIWQLPSVSFGLCNRPGPSQAVKRARVWFGGSIVAPAITNDNAARLAVRPT